MRVRALNAQETSSPWGYADKTYLSGKAGKPGTPVNLVASDNVVWNINITWAFPDGSGDTAYTEIQRSTTGDHANPQQLTLVPYPTSNYQHGMMPAGIRQWYRARLVDRIGNVGEWTAWVMGETSSQADEYLGDIGKNFMSSEDGKALMGQLETSLEAILQNSLADYDNVNQQWAQYGENKAGIIQASKVAADAEKAVAKLETDVAAQFGDTEAAIQEKMTAYTDASGGSAIYTLKTGIKYKGQNYDAGLSVAVTINGESVDTRVAVNANQFVVMSGSGSNVYSPFAIVNGQVFISDAFIQNGSITSAKIANAAINNAKISGSIWSEGYKVANQGGWCLSKADNNLSFTGPEGRLFVQIGKLTGVAPNV